MQFSVDKQTVQELNLTGRYRPDSIFSIFNHTVTRGASSLLEQHFNSPFSNADSIKERSKKFQFFCNNTYTLPFSTEEHESAEHYLEGASTTNLPHFIFQNIKRRLFSILSIDKEYNELLEQQKNSVKVLQSFIALLTDICKVEGEEEVRKEFLDSLKSIESSKLEQLANYNLSDNNFLNFLKFDYLLRYKRVDSIKEILDIIYRLDLYITVAHIGKKRDFSYASLLPESDNKIEIKGVYHPSIPNAVSNDLHFDSNKNVLFLTGANMAGKSTLMKAFGISIYLAHMGYPAPFHSMQFSTAEGLSTSINVADNLDMGYSHFYAEVVRVKEIAELVAQNRRVIVMFDELFKGTNVKDAHEATVKITAAFAKKRKCSFVISTHIMEAGEELKKSEENITFRFLPSTLVGSRPKYSYKLESGISDDRHGMTIIKDEKIIEIINSAP